MGWLRKQRDKLKDWFSGLVGGAVGFFLLPFLGPLGAIAAGLAAAAVTQAGIGMIQDAFNVPNYGANAADGASAVNNGILVNTKGTNTQIPVVYGARKLGGHIVYMSTNGTDNQSLFLVMCFAEGQINAFKELYLDDRLVANENSIKTDDEGGITDSAYSTGDRLRYQLMSNGQNVPSWWLNEGAGNGGWTGNHELSGLAVGYFRFRWVNPATGASNEDAQKTINANPYKGVPKIQVVMEGKKTPVATSYVDGATDSYDSMTKVYSTNPADHMLDYLMNPIYGRGLDHSRIGFTSFKVASIKFDTTVTYQNGTSGKILENNIVVGTNRTMLQNVQTMLQNMRSGMPYVQGKFNLKLLDTGHASNPTSTPSSSDFTSVGENEIVGGLVIEGLGHRDQYNQIRAVYPDPDTNWEINEVVYPAVNSITDSTLLAEDNGRRLTKEISLEGVTNGNLAGDIASTVLLRSRKKKMVSFTTTAELHNCVVGDLLKITYPSLGMTDAQFRITSHQIGPDYNINITALEHNPTDYDFTNVDVFIPKPVTPGAPGTPINPAPVNEWARIGVIDLNPAQVMLGFTLRAIRYTFNPVWATDQTDYVSALVEFSATGTTANGSGAKYILEQLTPQEFGSAKLSATTTVGLDKKYHWLRIVYVKSDGNLIVGPWSVTGNPAIPPGAFSAP